MKILLIISIFLLVLATLYLVAVNTSRSNAVAVIMIFYKGSKTDAECPFTDIENDPNKEAICAARALHITAGTTATTFSPNDKALWWQWLVFIGKLGMANHYS